MKRPTISGRITKYLYLYRNITYKRSANACRLSHQLKHKLFIVCVIALFYLLLCSCCCSLQGAQLSGFLRDPTTGNGQHQSARAIASASHHCFDAYCFLEFEIYSSDMILQMRKYIQYINNWHFFIKNVRFP